MAAHRQSPYRRLLPLLLLGSLLLILVTGNMRQQTRYDERVVGIQEVDTQEEVSTTPVQPALRPTHLYHSTRVGWLRLPVSTTYLGASQRLETRHFVYRYHPDDAQTVAAVAAQFDPLFVELHQLYLGSSPSGVKRVVVVDPFQQPSQILPRASAAEPLVVSSPAAFAAAEQISADQLLAQSLLLALLDELTSQVILRHQNEGNGHDHARNEVRRARLGQVLRGVKLWHLWRSDLPLSTWREPVVQWVYHSAQGRLPEKGAVTPAFWPELCAMHRLWMATPLDIGIPTICDPSEEGQHYSWLRPVDTPPWQLAQIPLYTLDSVFVADESAHPAATVAIAMLIEYAASTYDADSVPLLLETVSSHTHWESLIPAVFGVSAAEFAAGRQTYIRDLVQVD